MSVRLSDEQWKRIWAFLQQQPHIYVRQEAQTRRFVEAVLWLTRSGSQWRLLPAAYGHWNSIYKRFARWQQRGVWEQ